MISRLFNMGKIPGVFHRLFPAYLWKKKTKERVLYLTFDDGPTPELSKWVADKLESFGGKGTFFQVANNVKKHPEITHELLERGHEVGNHSFHHLNGWKSGLITYLRDFRKAESTLRE
ncbi:MAG: polysaccharide deacetylase family protein, partial [Bacteroidota bacterium]